MKPDKPRSGRTRRSLLAAPAFAAALMLGGATAWAGTLASGYLWSENADRMVCFVWNVSDSPVTLQSAKVVNEDGVAFATFGNCSGTLQPSKRCGFVAYNLQQAAGRVTIDTPRNRVRGPCQLRDDIFNETATTEMR